MTTNQHNIYQEGKQQQPVLDTPHEHKPQSQEKSLGNAYPFYKALGLTSPQPKPLRKRKSISSANPKPQSRHALPTATIRGRESQFPLTTAQRSGDQRSALPSQALLTLDLTFTGVAVGSIHAQPIGRTMMSSFKLSSQQARGKDGAWLRGCSARPKRGSLSVVGVSASGSTGGSGYPRGGDGSQPRARTLS